MVALVGFRCCDFHLKACVQIPVSLGSVIWTGFLAVITFKIKIYYYLFIMIDVLKLTG